MRKIITPALWMILALPLVQVSLGQNLIGTSDPIILDSNSPVELLRNNKEYSSVSIVPALMDEHPGIAVLFEGTDDLHYYAKSETAPAPGLQLKVRAESDAFQFNSPLFPKWHIFKDSAGSNVEVHAGRFTVFIPINYYRAGAQDSIIQKGEINVTISGIACTSIVCLPPFEKVFRTTIDVSEVDSWKSISIGETSEQAEVEPDEVKPVEIEQTEVEQAPSKVTEETKQTRQAVLPYSTVIYYLLAILAGISINIMPCVLPVIPLIILRLIDQSKRQNGSRFATGAAFCLGVVLFFAAFALISVVINLTTGAVLDINSLFRYPSAVVVLFLAVVLFGLAMLDIITLSLPSSVMNRQGAGSGLAGTAGMGFFAGILSTPCSGALLGFILVWAQTQTRLVSSTAIILMGVGMALPYAVVMSIPSLLNRIPKPGAWMDIFKKSTGFLLFLIAAKLTLAALPKERLLNVLMYGIIFSFCVWMWGKWVNLATPKGKRRAVRLTALFIAIATGIWLLPVKELPKIDWRQYDRDIVQQATLQKQPVLLKFTADWCTNCKVVEARVYRDPEVAGQIERKNVLAIKADTTVIDYTATIDLKKVYGEAGNVPLTILLLPNGDKQKLRGIFNKLQLIEILEKLPERKVDGQKEGDEAQK